MLRYLHKNKIIKSTSKYAFFNNQAKGMMNQYQEVEELLTMIQSEKIRNDFTYINLLARACM
jgi:hypothetical protein